MFLCDWDHTAFSQHWKQKQWPSRVSLTSGAKNTTQKSLVDPQNIVLPPFHTKLGSIKGLVKALQKDGHCFKYLCSGLSDAKLKEGMFVEPDRRKSILDKMF
jgi:hypothetical protein